MNSLSAKFLNGKITRNLVLRLQSSSTTVSSSITTSEIQIPSRIERGPTDILKALSSTVSRDITAAHYKYHDDPYLIPLSNTGKRIFSLSKEAGKKAAKWVRQEHADLFQHRVADPVIAEFLPLVVYKDKSEVSEEILLDIIKQGRVSDAVNVYNLLEENVGIKTKQALLELLCFYNSEEPLAEDLLEERWYRQTSINRTSTWTHNPVIEKLFIFLKKQDRVTIAAAYNTLICGTAKYIKIDGVWNMYQECKQNDIALNVHSYNSLIKIIPYLKDGNDERKYLLHGLLVEMAENGVCPNIGTLNATLSMTTKLGSTHMAKDIIRNVLAEFQRIGIQPSLASFYYVLTVFYKDDNSTSNALVEIMKTLQGKTFTMQDPMDIFFFSTAMNVAYNHLQDRTVADKIHELLLLDKNYCFIGDGLKESIYYRYYMSLLLITDSLENFMKIYGILVPHIYIPEPSVMLKIFDAVGDNSAEIGRELLPRLFSHMVMFNQLERQPLITKILTLMRVHCKPPAKSPLHKQYAENAWILWNHIQEVNDKRKYHFVNLTGGILADIAILLLRNDDFDKALKVIYLLEREQSNIINIPSSEQLDDIFKACIIRGHVPSALALVHYAVDNDFEEAISMARLLQQSLPLNPDQSNKLSSLVGDEALKSEVSSNQ